MKKTILSVITIVSGMFIIQGCGAICEHCTHEYSYYNVPVAAGSDFCYGDDYNLVNQLQTAGIPVVAAGGTWE